MISSVVFFLFFLSSGAGSTSPVQGVFDGLLIMGGHHHIRLSVGCDLIQNVVQAPVGKQQPVSILVAVSHTNLCICESAIKKNDFDSQALQEMP